MCEIDSKKADESGEITDSFTYSAYGELVSHNGSTKTPFLYNGRDGVMTDENGLYYMRARYYNPDIKRFINQDVILGDITNSPTLNRYAYVNGNPVSYVDPFGLSAEVEKRLLDALHIILDGLGLVDPTPISDLLSAALYYYEDDMINMGLSLGAALLPAMSGGAVYGAKWGSKAYRATEAVGAVGKIASNADVITRGAAKYGDEVVEAVTGIAKYGDDVEHAVKGLRQKQLLLEDKRFGQLLLPETSSAKKLSWNEFQSANKGNYNRKGMVDAYNSYSSGFNPLIKENNHGNSLLHEGINYGYALVDKDTREILKFGESISPHTRYTKDFLQINNAEMMILESGSKEYIHYWQFDMNMYFFSKYKELPRLNKKGW